MANLGAEGVSQVNVEIGEKRNMEKSDTRVLGRLQKHKNGGSGCGIVTKAVDGDSWITSSKIAVPRRACTVMVTGIAGARVLV